MRINRMVFIESCSGLPAFAGMTKTVAKLIRSLCYEFSCALGPLLPFRYIATEMADSRGSQRNLHRRKFAASEPQKISHLWLA